MIVGNYEYGISYLPDNCMAYRDGYRYGAYKENMNKRYDELFDIESYSLNPTAWELVNDEWKRLMEY